MAGFLVEADWWLYLMMFVSIVILLAINLYIVVIWQHPDDKNEAYFPKAVVRTVADGLCLKEREGSPTCLKARTSTVDLGRQEARYHVPQPPVATFPRLSQAFHAREEQLTPVTTFYSAEHRIGGSAQLVTGDGIRLLDAGVFHVDMVETW